MKKAGFAHSGRTRLFSVGEIYGDKGVVGEQITGLCPEGEVAGIELIGVQGTLVKKVQADEKLMGAAGAGEHDLGPQETGTVRKQGLKAQIEPVDQFGFVSTLQNTVPK